MKQCIVVVSKETVVLPTQFCCPAVNPRTCTDFHWVLGAQMKDGEFEFVYHFNNHFNLFFRCMPSEKRCHSLLSSSVDNNKQKQGFK